jgi:hypothetical protein
MQIHFSYQYETDDDEKTNPNIPAICSPEYARVLKTIPEEHIAARAYYIWKSTGCVDQVKNWHDAEHQLIKEAKIKERESYPPKLLPL